jgi:hypothetical protein
VPVSWVSYRFSCSFRFWFFFWFLVMILWGYGYRHFFDFFLWDRLAIRFFLRRT